MDIRITPYSTLRSYPKENLVDNRNRFTHINKSPTAKSKQLIFSTKISQPKNLNNIFILSKKTSVVQPNALTDKKGVLLYQQIERNKLFSNGTELLNRFNLKT